MIGEDTYALGIDIAENGGFEVPPMGPVQSGVKEPRPNMNEASNPRLPICSPSPGRENDIAWNQLAPRTPTHSPLPTPPPPHLLPLLQANTCSTIFSPLKAFSFHT
ncbi:hypothetical protein JZ751_029398, partial [Albula glossodonta]